MPRPRITCSPSTRARPARARSSSTTSGAIVALAQQEFRQIFPQPGWVEHDPEEIWAHAARRGARGARARPGSTPTRHRRHRHHQPARDDGGLGPRDRRADRTTPSSGRTGAPPRSATSCARDGLEPLDPRARPASSSTPISPAPSSPGCSTTSPARARAAEARRARVRHRRHLAGLEADRRRAARHRRHQRLAHAAVQHPHRRLGRRAARSCSTCRARCCPRCARRARSTARPRRPCSARRCRSPGIAGDQQAALFGQACFEPGHGQEHLRHRLLPAA